MNRLFVCNNPYQIIVAILIAKQNEKDGDCKDIIITDNFNGADRVFHNLSLEKYFDTVYMASVNSILFPKTKGDMIRKCINVLCTKRFLKKTLNSTSFFLGKYDEIYYNNDDMFLYGIVSFCLGVNDILKVYRFEEGYSSYLRPYCSVRAQKLFDRRNPQKKFREIISGMYYFFPEYIQFNSPAELKKISVEIDEDIRKVIRSIFPVTNFFDQLNGKWIIFEESFYQDLGYNEDMKIFEQILKTVGVENVVVKLHPRSTKNRFEEYGVEILECGDAPWEAVLLLNDFSNVRFLALASGSIINSRMMLKNQTESFLLYKCVDKSVPSLNIEFQRFIERFKDNCANGLHIPENMDRFLHILKNGEEQ